MEEVTFSNWEAEIVEKLMPPFEGSTLDVSVEASAAVHIKASLIKKVHQGKNHHILLLEVVLHTIRVAIPNPQLLKFSEAVEGPGTFTSVEVWFAGKLVHTFSPVPVLI